MSTILEFYRNAWHSVHNPQEFHAITVHFPIAISVLGLVMAVCVAIWAGKSSALRWTCVGLYVVGAAAAFLATNAGDGASEHFSDLLNARGAMSTPEAMHALKTLERHEAMADKVWMFMAAAALLAAATALKPPPARTIALVLLIAAGVATAGWVAATAQLGGSLVYEHGVGVPTSSNNLPPPKLTVP